ncbi:hypothetical protein A2U01_0030228 [Trifolium medium]|uniref:Uncharacterized protein n=1 Tax=Trifolium medium TaxID=97028 RepID=A0A392PE51_9FABA|nr:hypothetical protein [Trifolium medium]
MNILLNAFFPLLQISEILLQPSYVLVQESFIIEGGKKVLLYHPHIFFNMGHFLRKRRSNVVIAPIGLFHSMNERQVHRKASFHPSEAMEKASFRGRELVGVLS